MLAKFSDYIGLSILWAIPFLNVSKVCLMLRSVSQTLSGRPLDLKDSRDKRLEGKVKEQSESFNKQIEIKDLKIIEAWNSYYGYIAGVDLFKKRSIMIVTPGLDLIDNDAFQWLYKHESYYVVNRSFLKTQTIKSLSVMIAAISFSIILGYSFFSSVLYTILVGFFIDLLCSHTIENRADSFALLYSSEEELKGALRFLKVAQEENKKKTMIERFFKYLMHPSYPFRMRRIKKILAKRKVTYELEDEKLNSLRRLLEKNNLEEQIFIEAKKQQVLRWIDADED